MVDFSRLSGAQIQHHWNTLRAEQDKTAREDALQTVRDKQQTQNGTGYRGLHDLIRSDFYKTVKGTLSNNRKKEHIQKQLNSTIDNLSDDKLKDFADEF